MATPQEFIAWAEAQIGTVEKGGPHGNDGNIVVYWDLIHHHQLQGCPWCDAFIEAGELAVGVPVIVDSQYCPTVEGAYAKAGRLFPVNLAVPGDQGFCHFPGEPDEANHTVLIVSNDVANQVCHTIEGNTSPGTYGSQSNGGGVYPRTRPWSVFRDVGRPTYDPSIVAPEPHPLSPPIISLSQELDVQLANTAKVGSALAASMAGVEGRSPEAGWFATADGGVNQLTDDTPFWGGYFNLPAPARNAPRICTGVFPRRDKGVGYEVCFNDGAYYTMGPGLNGFPA